ncbi:MAG: hypothetical protein C4524_08765 [Candidatus Zixiibacteriota bacterium]|nr:MAG: hypothetical protein C4524_08765 [candidate division Zixibacteria bacterium]
MKENLLALRLLLDLKAADWLGALRGMTTSQVLRLLVSLALAAGISLLIYFFDLFIFKYLMGAPDLGKLVLARFFELAFLLFFSVLMISTALTALSMLYREDELAMLFSLPLSQGAIFTAKYLEVIFYSSWALVVLTIPFILSYAVYFDVNWVALFSLFAGLLLPLVLISGSLGVGAAVMLRWLLGGLPRRQVFTWAAVVLGLVVTVFLVVILSRQGVSQKGFMYLVMMLDAENRQDPSLVPHELIARGFFSLLENRYDALERIILTLLGLCSLTVLLVLDMGRVLYYRSYLAGLDRSHRPARARSRLFDRSWKTGRNWLSPLYRALLTKDLLEFRRSPLQWSQVLLLLGFWALYLANLGNLGLFFDLRSQFWKMLFFYGNLCFACYFAAALAGRFVFPLVSLEGRGLWMLRSAPVAMDTLIWAKFWQAFLPLFFLAGTVVAVGDIILGVHSGLTQVSLLVIFVVTFSLTALALGLGAVFADYSQANPMKIANTPGGILCIFISLVFSVLVTTIVAWPAYQHYKFTQFQAIFPLTEWVTAVIMIIALGLLLTVIPLKLGLAALNSDLKNV